MESVEHVSRERAREPVWHHMCAEEGEEEEEEESLS